MPDDMDFAEKIYFITLRGLCHEFHKGRIDESRLRKEAYLISLEYNKNIVRRNILNNNDWNYKRLEIAAMEFSKNKTIESAERFYRAVYNLEDK